jgi:hypothetical protein
MSWQLKVCDADGEAGHVGCAATFAQSLDPTDHTPFAQVYEAVPSMPATTFVIVCEEPCAPGLSMATHCGVKPHDSVNAGQSTGKGAGGAGGAGGAVAEQLSEDGADHTPSTQLKVAAPL